MCSVERGAQYVILRYDDDFLVRLLLGGEFQAVGFLSREFVKSCKPNMKIAFGVHCINS